jgi:hypothetical protein
MKSLWDRIGPLALPLALLVLLGRYWHAFPDPKLIFITFGIILAIGMYFPAVLIINPDADKVHVSIAYWTPKVTALIVFAFAVLIVLAFSTTFWGQPIDLRFFLSNAYVARIEVSDKPINLTPAFGNEALNPDYAGPGSGELGKLLEQMDVWKKWVNKGASSHTGTDKLIVYRSRPSSGFFEGFDGVIEFPKLDGARLAEGAAFLIHSDTRTGRITWRPLNLLIDRMNMDRTDETLTNKISDVVLDGGDQFFVLLEFVSKDGKDLPADLDKWTANIEVQ